VPTGDPPSTFGRGRAYLVTVPGLQATKYLIDT
jgi:hypothetical protein